MGSTFKRPFRSFNGTDWDIHYFDTSEDMIKSGWVQKAATTTDQNNCYRKFPGGMIEQFGQLSVQTASNKNLDTVITLPMAYPVYGPIYADAYVLSGNTWQAIYLDCICQRQDKGAFRVVNVSGLDASALYELHWWCTGY